MEVQVFVERTSGAAALFTCSIGTGTYTREWPLREVVELDSSPRSSRIGRRRPDKAPLPTGGVLSDDFQAICFMKEGNPAAFGADPSTQPPLAPFPITLGMQARCQTADNFVSMEVSEINVVLTRSS
jgi:hypothetical protein